jgi:Icc protein
VYPIATPGAAAEKSLRSQPVSARILHLTDIHLREAPGDAPDSPDRTLGRVLAAVGDQRFDLAVLTGDLSDDGRLVAQQRLADAVAPLGCPVLATPGNHDDPAHVRTVFGGETTHQVGGWRIVTVDTTIVGRVDGRVDSAGVIAELGPDDGPPTVLALHHPPVNVSSHSDFQLAGAAGLVAALAARTDVRVVLSGHVHEHFHVHIGAVAYLGGPSTWYGLTHHGLGHRRSPAPPGALALTLGDDGSVDWATISPTG